MPGKGIAVASGTAGIILVWSGVQNRSVLSVTRDLIAGTKPAPGPGSTPAASGSGTVTAAGGAPAAGMDAQNQALGRLLAAPYGWSAGAEWTAFNNIVMAESGWNVSAQNPTSTAAGIAQDIQGYGPGYRAGDATSQINWMLAYIKQRYGDPVNAWAFHLANGYY
jgi:hypothetical protein